MEKNLSNEKKYTDETLSLSNRNNLKLNGIIEILSSSENALLLKLKDTLLTITGKDMHIKKLDITLGELEVYGIIDCIKYGKTANIFKRMFK